MTPPVPLLITRKRYISNLTIVNFSHDFMKNNMNIVSL